MLLSVAGLRHALTTSIQCSLNAKVKLINKPSSQAPKSKVAGVRWWDKLVNYSSSPVRDARDILHMCHGWHKIYILYIYRENDKEIHRFYKIRNISPANNDALVKGCIDKLCLISLQHIGEYRCLFDIFTTKRTNRFSSWWTTSGWHSWWH